MASDNKNRLIFHHNPASLKDIAAVIGATLLWRAEIIKNNYKIDSLKRIYPSLKSAMKIPAPVEKLFDRYIRQTKKSLIDWMEFHYLRVFYPSTRTYEILKYYDLIQWRFDCSIDFDSTAKNLIACKDLDKVTRYRIACIFCFEDDIRALWPEVVYDDTLRDLDFFSDPLVCYWTFRLDDKTTTIDSRNRDVAASKMIEGDVINTRSALLYLWKNCDPEEQRERAVKMMMNSSEDCAKHLLPLMDESQLEDVIQRVGSCIMRALSRSAADTNYVLQMWEFMKDRVHGENFVDIFDEIGKLNSTHVHVPALLYDIWRNATDELRNFAVEKYLDGIMHLFYDKDQLPLKNLPRDTRLIYELLSYKSLEERNRFWCDEWYDLIIGVCSADLVKLMKLCFENDEAIAAFKKINFIDYSRIQYYCELLLSKGFFDELNEFLNFCSSDRNVVAGLKKKILWSEKFVKFYINYFEDSMKMCSFNEFIKDMQPLSRNRVNLPGQIVISYWNNGYLRQITNGRNLVAVKNLICLFLTRENDMKKAKKSFKQTCHRILSTGKFKQFDADEWNEVLLWCMNNDKLQLDKFKETIPIHDVLPVLLARWFETVDDSLSNHPRFDPEDFMNEGIYEYYENKSIEIDDSDDTIVEQNGLLDNRNDFRARSMQNDFDDEDVNANNKVIYDDDDDDVDDHDIDGCSRTCALDQYDMLDNFLTWYCSGNQMKIKQLKMSQIQKYNVAPLNNVLNSCNARLIKIVLDWLFDGDNMKIEKYKTALSYKI